MRLVIVLICLLPGAALAQEADCANAVAQADLTDCAAKEWEAADRELNKVYPQAIAAMRDIDSYLEDGEKGAEEALRKAQRAWVEYRDNACLAQGFWFRGGSAEPMIVYGCMARLTEEQIAFLKALTGDY